MAILYHRGYLFDRKMALVYETVGSHASPSKCYSSPEIHLSTGVSASFHLYIASITGLNVKSWISNILVFLHVRIAMLTTTFKLSVSCIDLE